MLVALLCATSTFAMTTVRMKQAGTLGTLLTQVQQDTCTALAIKGKLNSMPMTSGCARHASIRIHTAGDLCLHSKRSV